jgi:type I restriction-modification system DNA methylase subunit
MSAQNGLVQRLWSYCNVLRDDGLSYGDYLEQLTYLLFLKMADEQTKPPFSRTAIVPEGSTGHLSSHGTATSSRCTTATC